MNPGSQGRSVCERLAAAAVALAAILASGPLWAQVTPTPAGALERAAALIQDREFDQAEAVLRELLAVDRANRRARRSEEHTSELQSLRTISYAVFCLKKKKTTPYRPYYHPLKNTKKII